MRLGGFGWETVHGVVQLLSTIGLVVAAATVGPALRRFMKIRPATYISGALYFASAAIAHLAITLGWEGNGAVPWPILLNDTVHAVSLCIFIVGVWLDIQDTIQRVAMAMVSMRYEYAKRVHLIEDHVREGGAIDAVWSAEQVARWTGDRLLAAFNDTEPPAPPPIATR